MSGSPANVWATPSRKSGWSSTTTTRMESGISSPDRVEREAADHARSLTSAAFHLERPPQALHAFPHSQQAEVTLPLPSYWPGKSRPAVGDLNLQTAALIA